MAGYGDDQGLADWLAENGYTLPSGAPAAVVLRQRGSTYVDAVYGARLYCSQPTGGALQERAWPRTGHFVNHLAVPSDVIPLAWVNASYRAALIEAMKPGTLMATIDPLRRVKRQKVDMIEREFFDGGALEAGEGGTALINAEIDGMVAPLLCLRREDLKGLGFWAIGC